MSDFADILSSPLWPALKSGLLENPDSLPQLISLIKAVDPPLGAKIEKDSVGLMKMIQTTASEKYAETQEQSTAEAQDGNDWATDLWESVASDSCLLSDAQQLELETHLFEFDDL